MVCFSAEPIFTNDNRLTQFRKNVDINVYAYSILHICYLPYMLTYFRISVKQNGVQFD
jgi:hypothetical protein